MNFTKITRYLTKLCNFVINRLPSVDGCESSEIGNKNGPRYRNLKQYQQRQITMKRYFQIPTTVSINCRNYQKIICNEPYLLLDYCNQYLLIYLFEYSKIDSLAAPSGPRIGLSTPRRGVQKLVTDIRNNHQLLL